MVCMPHAPSTSQSVHPCIAAPPPDHGWTSGAVYSPEERQAALDRAQAAQDQEQQYMDRLRNDERLPVRGSPPVRLRRRPNSCCLGHPCEWNWDGLGGEGCGCLRVALGHPFSFAACSVMH